MALLRRIFHRCRFLYAGEPMLYKCSCGRKRWGLFDEGEF